MVDSIYPGITTYGEYLRHKDEQQIQERYPPPITPQTTSYLSQKNTEKIKQAIDNVNDWDDINEFYLQNPGSTQKGTNITLSSQPVKELSRKTALAKTAYGCRLHELISALAKRNIPMPPSVLSRLSDNYSKVEQGKRSEAEASIAEIALFREASQFFMSEGVGYDDNRTNGNIYADLAVTCSANYLLAMEGNVRVKLSAETKADLMALSADMRPASPDTAEPSWWEEGLKNSLNYYVDELEDYLLTWGLPGGGGGRIRIPRAVKKNKNSADAPLLQEYTPTMADRHWLSRETEKTTTSHGKRVYDVSHWLGKKDIPISKATANVLAKNVRLVEQGKRSLPEASLVETSALFRESREAMKQGNHKYATICLAGSLTNLLGFFASVSSSPMNAPTLVSREHRIKSLIERNAALDGLPVSGNMYRPK